MAGIIGFCDQAARFVMDPLNPIFSPRTQCLAGMTTVLVGISTFGMAQMISALWRKLRHLEELNETHKIISEQFKKLFPGKIEIEEGENISHTKLLAIRDHLKQHHTGQQKKFLFKDPTGKEYFAWFVSNYQVINIQPVVDFARKSMDNKLGIKITDKGKVESVYMDGIPLAEGLPKGKETLPESLYSAIKIQDVKSDSLPADEPQQFSTADLMTFRAALLKTGRIVVDLGEEGKFVVWYNKIYSAINIQDEGSYNAVIQDGKLGIIIDEDGKINSLKINNIIQPNHSTTVPNEFLSRLHACFNKALEVSSAYTLIDPQHSWVAPIQIAIVRRGLKEIPEFHLQNLSRAIENKIKTTVDPKIKVSFLKDDLNLANGIDAGGLSRDYFDDLFDGIQLSKELDFVTIQGSSLVLPHSKEEYTSIQGLPILNDQEKSVYQDIGKVISYCYHSQIVPGHYEKTYLIGRHFDDALFHAALCLTAEEIDTPFENLTLQTKLKMCEALLDVRAKAGMDVNFLAKRIKWLNKLKNLDQKELGEAAFDVMYAECLSEDFIKDAEPDVEKISKNLKQFEACLIDAIFSQNGGYGQLGVQLAPIHAIAQGMKSICHPRPFQDPNDNHYWNTTFHLINPAAFSNKVQGTLNRKEIAAQIKVDSNLQDSDKLEIEKKIIWLQEWIEDEKEGASEEELKDLLKFLTGSSSLPKDKDIHVIAQCGTYYPVPIAHTCSFEMELAPMAATYGVEFDDFNKKNFIKSLKELVLIDPSTYQMD